MNTPFNAANINKLKQWLGSGSINIFGRPFSGKDTQSKRLAMLFDAALIGGGDIIRGSQQAPEISKIGDQGKLVPQQAFLDMVLPCLQKAEFKNKPLILNSIGRWHGEEKPIMEACEQAGHALKAVINLEVPEETVYSRWQEARVRHDRGPRFDDAQKEVLQTRLREFKTKTLPVLDFYKNQGLVITIDGTPSEDDVIAKIIDKLLSFEN